ncbi:Zn-ribbon domain-containing OB-fold protein [Haloarcula salinisoli]|uniref:Nucleic acid-binding protein n=1 Tax=Haloarcula salinisoli TaxID=2487746 RepID=A0A8J8C7A7_9EURY|nr:nucleic acid-binding protein [Halomicroarcula salinisoli]MBX0285376.1 nucleic acid-binding protein [Halomicroarcula salinisoli]MBX0303146.1 nucleic acid-binding protein [Halomicroarcula salinisoli]
MTLEAGICPNGHVSYPTHPRCPNCGEPQDERMDLSEERAEVVTWTKSTATPPGVREPNTMAIVEFDISHLDLEDTFVRALGQVTTEDVETGDVVEPVYVEELRDPDVGLKSGNPESQDWDGYRWDPI